MARCKWCEKKGFFLSVNKDGLCKSCSPMVHRDVYANGKIIKSLEKLSKNTRELNVRTKQCEVIIKKAREILKYEEKGIPTYTPPPSELIKIYTVKRDKLIMESMPEKVEDALEVATFALSQLKSISMVNKALQKINDARALLEGISLPMRIVALINQKGGVGKTTSTLNIGAGLTKLNKKVLLIDFDPQANLSDGMGIETEDLQFSVYDLIKGKATLKNVIVKKNNLSLLPSNIFLTRADKEFTHIARKNHMLRDTLTGLKEYDYVLIDCPPSLGFLTLNALTAATDVYIPLQPEYFALKGIRKLLDAVEFVRQEGNEKLIIRGIIGTRYDQRKNLHKEVINKIQESLGNELFYAYIRENIALAEASSHGKSIFEYKPRSHGAEDYMNLCKEIVKRDDSRTEEIHIVEDSI